MSGRQEAPIEDYLDDLLRRTRADARTTRRLLDEAADHLYAAAGQNEAAGMTAVEAQRDAVRRLGPVDGLTGGAWRRSFWSMVLEVVRAAIFLGACGLVAIGLSGGVVVVMNAVAGDGFVGGATVLGVGGHSVGEAAQDAASLRILAGVVGLIILAGRAVLRRSTRAGTVLPAGLTDALGAAAFAAATAVLASATVDQAVTGTGGHGVGFFLSGALVSLLGAVLFCARATRALIPGRPSASDGGGNLGGRVAR